MPFCKYCGRKLEDGEVCDCRQQAPVETPVEAPAAAPASPVTAGKAMPSADQTKEMAQQIGHKLLLLLKAPVSNSAAYVKEGNLIVSIALMVLHALCSGLFAVLLISKINSVIGLGGRYTAALKFSGVGGFFLTILYSLILALVLSLLFFGAAKLLHVQMNFQNALAVVSMRSFISAPIALLSSLLVLINVPLGLVFFYCIGMVAGVIFLMIASNGIQMPNHDRKAYMTAAVILLFVLISTLFASLVFRTYLPSGLGSFFSLENLIG